MKPVATISIVLLGYVFAVAPARAPDACKECSEFHRACVKAHSKEACKVDYAICVKPCGKQN
jgi:hypothetical protein